MRVLLKQFLGKNHSWAICGHAWARSLKNLGHQVDLFSTDGIAHLPVDLKENLLGYTEENSQKVIGKNPHKEYDMQLSYTCMKNFSSYLSFGSKNRIGCWCYEWAGANVLPSGFAKHYKSCDVLMVPSNYAKRVFMESKIPEHLIKVIPHGIYVNDYKQETKIDLKTNKRFKILANIAQNHLRKNIPGLLESYGKAFTKSDDVILILKAKERPVKNPFDISLNKCIDDFNKKFPNHAEIKILNEFLPDISSLYRSIDAVFTMSHCEGYYMPAIEAMASGKLNIAPNWGGQVDMLNNSNALLVSGKEVRANPKSMYWEANANALWFQPDIDDAADKLKFAYNNFESLNSTIESQREAVYSKYNWDTVVQQMLSICDC